MRITNFLLLLITLIHVISCDGGTSNNDFSDINPKSNKSELRSFELTFSNSVFKSTIVGTDIILDRQLSYGIYDYTISKLQFSNGATANKSVGNSLVLNQNSQTITITAEDGISTSQYDLIYEHIDFESIVEKNGRLQVNGNKIVNKNNEPVSFAGNSFFWSNDNWGGERFYKASVVEWLKLDWETTIVRAAMGVDESGGYLEDKNSNKNRVKTIVDAAIDQGLYVIIDWHSHHAEDYTDDAVAFFEEMATLYGDYDNVIYEIYNEPLNVSWTNDIKPYAETVIAAIRSKDPDNLILVGTPEWSQRVDLAAADPITSSTNIAYVLHFYTVHHQQWLRDRASAALDAGIAIFITEWGSIGYTQDDPEAIKWMEWCKANDISHCSWAVNSKEEEWSIVKSGSNNSGNWSENDLTESGKLSRMIIRNWENE